MEVSALRPCQGPAGVAGRGSAGRNRSSVVVRTQQSTQATSNRRSAVRCYASGEPPGTASSFFNTVKALAKRAQGAMPIVGLVSRLATPEGGFDEQAYPEYSRYMIEKAPIGYRIAQADLEKMYGKPANSRYIMLVIWMTKMGVGLLPPKDIIYAAKRLRVTQDIEMEMDRFDQNKGIILKKYSMVSRPEGRVEDKVSLAVDALCTLCIGLKEGEAVPEAAAPLLRDLVVGAFPEAPEALVAAAVANRASRALSYS